MSKLTVDIWSGLGAGAVLAIVMWILVMILALPTMWLWNWLMPTLFNLPSVTFWQALGLNALSTILLKPIQIGGNNK